PARHGQDPPQARRRQAGRTSRRVAMTCAEFKELCGAYALGAVDEEERVACEAHLAEPTHEGCREALAAPNATVNAIPLPRPPLRPKPEVWAGIERQLAPAIPLAPRRKLWPVAVPTVLFAAAAALALYLWTDRSALVERAGVAERTLAGERATAATALGA